MSPPPPPPTDHDACTSQTLRGNAPAGNVETYYRTHVAVPILDHLLSQFDTKSANS